jgi:SAM-dependent methyltransferase
LRDTKVMTTDPTRGWEAVAGKFMQVRSDIGADVILHWTRHLRPAASVVDIGCGSGVPVSEVLAGRGFELFGLDASPTMLSAFRHRFPKAPTACETAESSNLFGRKFDGAVAVGLMFLLPENSQRSLIARIARALNPGGRFLFTAPAIPCEWLDTLTGQPSRSLGLEEYGHLLADEGMHIVETCVDGGGNHYIHAKVMAEA